MPIQAAAITFTRPQRAEYQTGVRLAEMDEDGVLLRTEYSTISRGTELDLYTGQMHGKGAHAQWYPMLPGYMPVGIVEAVGKNVTHVQVGDRVVGSNLFSGMDERYCTAWAGHLERVVISRHSHKGMGGLRAVRIPAGVAPDRAGLGMLGGVAWHGVRDKINPQPGELIVVIGMGVIGLFAAQFCRMQGARVIAVDLFDNRLAVARQNGLTETVQTTGKAIITDVLHYLGGQMPDAVIEVTGEQEPLHQALELVKPYGRIHAQGMYLDAPPPDLFRYLFGRNLTLSSTGGETPAHTAEVLAMMAEGKVTTEGMLSAIAEPKQATEVYDKVYRFPDQYMTCAFRW